MGGYIRIPYNLYSLYNLYVSMDNVACLDRQETFVVLYSFFGMQAQTTQVISDILVSHTVK